MPRQKIFTLCGLLIVALLALFIGADPALAEQQPAKGEAQAAQTAPKETERIAGSYMRQGNLLVLMYHDFNTEPPQDKEHIELVSTAEKFAADIDALLALGYLPISLEDFYFGQAVPGQKYFSITFDDGYQGVYTIAYPVLLEKQVPGAVFFNTGMEHYPAFLHYQQLQEMEQSGLVKIYSHLAYHTKATKLPVGEYTRYLDASVSFLNKYVGRKPMFLAYPYGDYNEEVYHIAKERGICLQFVQKMSFAATDVIVRVNVPYDADMAILVEEAAHN